MSEAPEKPPAESDEREAFRLWNGGIHDGLQRDIAWGAWCARARLGQPIQGGLMLLRCQRRLALACGTLGTIHHALSLNPDEPVDEASLLAAIAALKARAKAEDA